MTLKEQIAKDLAKINADMDYPTFTFNGEDYACINSSNGKAMTLEMGGFAVEADLILVVSKDLFTDGSYPAVNSILTFNGINYKVGIVRNDAFGAYLRLICKDMSKGV